LLVHDMRFQHFPGGGSTDGSLLVFNVTGAWTKASEDLDLTQSDPPGASVLSGANKVGAVPHGQSQGWLRSHGVACVQGCWVAYVLAC
jgi:hypothetical protein